jgi:4-amino-4-deoxy-L-arabinose transferase-like glycosyltransferase
MKQAEKHTSGLTHISRRSSKHCPKSLYYCEHNEQCPTQLHIPPGKPLTVNSAGRKNNELRLKRLFPSRKVFIMTPSTQTIKTKVSNTRLMVFLGLFIITFGAAALRVKDITENPPELYSDELGNFVSAKSIVEEGKDLQGRLLPFFYDRAESRPPIYGYCAYLASKFFINPTFAIRFPAIIFGLITIIMLFMLTLELTGSQVAALFSAFCLAIIPWHIHYSRVGWEPASWLPFLLTATVLLIKGINKNYSPLTLLGFAFFSLTIYTYEAAPLIAALFLLSIVILNHRYFCKNKKLFFTGALTSGIIALPYIWTAFHDPNMYERAIRISTFSKGLDIDSIKIFLNNYKSHFSLKFLFKDGDPNLRHGAQTGVLYWWMLPFMIIGAIAVGKSVKRRWFVGLIVFWIVVFPLVGALTDDGVPHATRTLIGAPMFCLLTGIGLWQSVIFFHYRLNSRILAACFVVAILFIAGISLIRFSKRYYLDYPKFSSIWWEFGHKEIFKKVKSMENKYQRACLENLNYWNELQLKKFYLDEGKLDIITDIKDPKCRMRDSIVVVRESNRIFVNGNLRYKVYNPENAPIYYIYTID